MGGRKNTGKFQGLVKVLMKFQGKKGKNNGKFHGVVKVLMKFQGKKGKNNGKFHGGIVSENGYLQQGGPD